MRLTLLLLALSGLSPLMHAADEPIPFSVSKTGQPGFPKVKFDEIWAAFRVEYYIDPKGALACHTSVGESLGAYFRLTRNGVSVEQARNDTSYRQGPAAAALLRLFGEEARLKVIDAGIPIRVAIVPLPENNSLFYSPFRKKSTGDTVAFGDKDDGAHPPKSCTFFPANPSKAYSGTFDCYAILTDEGIREVAQMPDSPELQKLFIDSLKAGKEFLVYMPNSISCQKCKGFGRGNGNDKTPCRSCSGTGKNSMVYLLKWE